LHRPLAANDLSAAVAAAPSAAAQVRAHGDEVLPRRKSAVVIDPRSLSRAFVYLVFITAWLPSSPAHSAIPAISGGWEHSVALNIDGTVRSWGQDTYGQLGTGRQFGSLTPTPTLGVSGLQAVSAGNTHTVALKSDGTVWAWGAGPLGDGTTTDQSNPVQVSGLQGMTAIAAGYGYTVALKGDGSVWAWGYNTSGQLGDGTTNSRYTAAPVAGLANVIAISAAATSPFSHTIALKGDGSVWAWGYNKYGELGDGTTIDRSSPVKVGGLTGVVAISACG
jgi:alpha-tubulin suppressor-like RCC1 family protein